MLAAMMFTKKLREPIMRGEITTSIRIWQKPHVKAGGTYALGPGHIRVAAIKEIGMRDITPAMARESGFEGVVDLLKTAKHGRGERVYLVEFSYEDRPAPAPVSARRPSSRRRGRRPPAAR
jgi:hypothetical protein